MAGRDPYCVILILLYNVHLVIQSDLSGFSLAGMQNSVVSVQPHSVGVFFVEENNNFHM